MLGVQFARKHRLDGEEDAKELGASVSSLVFLSLELLKDCSQVACRVEKVKSVWVIALEDGLMPDPCFEVLEYDAYDPLLLINCSVLE